MRDTGSVCACVRVRACVLVLSVCVCDVCGALTIGGPVHDEHVLVLEVLHLVQYTSGLKTKPDMQDSISRHNRPHTNLSTT